MIIQDEYTPSLDGVISYDLKIPDYNLNSLATAQADPNTGLFSQLETGFRPDFVTPNESSRYADPYLSYDPLIDNEDLYARIHPFTWGDSMAKGWKTFTNHVGSSFFTAASAIKGLATGEIDSISDNEYTQDLAEMTRKLEEEYPQYRTTDQSENPLAFRNWNSTLKSIFPAVGTVAGGITDMLIGHGIMTLATPITAGASGTIGNATQILRDSKILNNTFKTLYNTFKGTTIARGVGTFNNHRQAILSGLFYANGEAALQGALNGQDFYEKQLREYYKENGTPDLKTIQELQNTAEQVAKFTYGANLALIAGSNIVQFPTLLGGRMNERILKNLPYKLENNLLVKQSTLKPILAEFAKDAFAEGFEEYGQSIIDNTTQEYFSGRHPQVLSSILKGIQSNLNQEGFIDFLGGALIGGPVSLVGQGYQSLRRNSVGTEAITGFNTSTDNLLKSFAMQDRLNKDVEEAITSGEPYRVGDKISSAIFDIANTASKTHTSEVRKEFLNDLLNMDNEVFRNYTKLDLDEAQQAFFINNLIKEFNLAEGSLGLMNQRYRINPYIDKGFYSSLTRKLKALSPFKTKKELDAEIWEDFRTIQALKLFKSSLYKEHVDRLERELDTSLVNPNLKQAIKEWKESPVDSPVLDDVPKGFETFKTKLDRRKKFVESIEDLSPEEQFTKIVEYEGVNEADLIDLLKSKSILEYLIKDIKNSSTEKGEQKLLKEILQYKLFQVATVPEPIINEEAEPEERETLPEEIEEETEEREKIQEETREETETQETQDPAVDETTETETTIPKDDRSVTEQDSKQESKQESTSELTPDVTETTETQPEVVEEVTDSQDFIEPTGEVKEESILSSDLITKKKTKTGTIYTPPRGTLFLYNKVVAKNVIEKNGKFKLGSNIEEGILKKTSREIDPMKLQTIRAEDYLSITEDYKSDYYAPIADHLGIRSYLETEFEQDLFLEKYLEENKDINKEDITPYLDAKLIEIKC